MFLAMVRNDLFSILAASETCQTCDEMPNLTNNLDKREVYSISMSHRVSEISKNLPGHT